MPTETAIEENKTVVALAYEQANAAHMRTNSVVEFFASQRVDLEQQIEALQKQYDLACRNAAKGDGTDPRPIKAALEEQQARLHGTKLEHAEAVAAAEANSQKASIALRFWREEQWSLEEGRLKDRETALQKEAAAARDASQLADFAHGGAVRDLGQFRKAVERMRKEMP